MIILPFLKMLWNNGFGFGMIFFAMVQVKKQNNQKDLVAQLAAIEQTLRKQDQKQSRRELAISLFALGNMSFAALLLGQAFGKEIFDAQLALIGIVITILLYTTALMLLKGGDR